MERDSVFDAGAGEVLACVRAIEARSESIPSTSTFAYPPDRVSRRNRLSLARGLLGGDGAGNGLDENVRVRIREHERWPDLQDVLVAAGAADQDSLVA